MQYILSKNKLALDQISLVFIRQFDHFYTYNFFMNNARFNYTNIYDGCVRVLINN